jgi:hypothetical protein
VGRGCAPGHAASGQSHGRGSGQDHAGVTPDRDDGRDGSGQDHGGAAAGEFPGLPDHVGWLSLLDPGGGRVEAFGGLLGGRAVLAAALGRHGLELVGGGP